jgi:O-methyltransferase
VDTRPFRFEALDMSILNVHIGTRLEQSSSSPGAPGTLLGDYAEFGVFEGTTFLHAHHRIRPLMPWMRCFAFDSFQGLPPLTEADRDGEFREGQFACTQPRFEQILRENDADLSRIVIVPGWYDRVLNDELKQTHALSAVSIAFIDCDLYQSCVPVLEFLTNLVRQGSILMFDDWYNFKGARDKGVQRATREWLEKNPRIELEPWFPFCHHGRSFIVQVTG